MITKIYIAALVIFLIFGNDQALGRQAPTDTEIRQQIIQDSIAAYKATGHPCACPYDTARNGSNCGGRSAYSRPGGAAPLCFASDVTDKMVSDWRRQYANDSN
jgi:hypothetical protein